MYAAVHTADMILFDRRSSSIVGPYGPCMAFASISMAIKTDPKCPQVLYEPSVQSRGDGPNLHKAR